MFAFKPINRTLLVLYAFGLIATLAVAAEVKQGTITEIDGTRVVVTMRTEQLSVLVMPSTLVSLNGQPAKVSDLRVGDAATIMYVQQDDVSQTVQRLDAMRPSTPGNPDPLRAH